MHMYVYLHACACVCVCVILYCTIQLSCCVYIAYIMLSWVFVCVRSIVNTVYIISISCDNRSGGHWLEECNMLDSSSCLLSWNCRHSLIKVTFSTDYPVLWCAQSVNSFLVVVMCSEQVECLLACMLACICVCPLANVACSSSLYLYL